MGHSATSGIVVQAMSRFQWVAIAICVWLNVLDGFDVMVMAFTAPHVSAEWGLSGTEIGIALSAGLVGMAAGSLLLAPLSDRYGRRPVILWCMLIDILGMFMSGYARDVTELAVWRVVTGVGIGGMLASIGVIAAEYSTVRYRTLVMSLYTIGYPIGATLGGILAVALIEWHGWRAVFLVGALMTVVTVPLVLRWLPESIDFLVSRRTPDALARLNGVLGRMAMPPVASLPSAAQTAGTDERVGYAQLFRPALLANTMLIALAFFLLMFGMYFVLSWTPKLLVNAGMSTQQGITGGVLLNIGGIAGGLAFGWLSTRVGLRPLILVFLVSTTAALAAFGYFSGSLSVAFIVALLIGFALFGSMGGLYALGPVIYDASVRSTGLGWAIGIGRIGGIVSPVAVGALVDAGWGAQALYYLCAIPVLLAGFAVLLLRGRL